MIPKIIHYIWLGGKEEPAILKKCKASWKKFCPDYEIKRWDESNLNIDCCAYCRDAYDAKKYAFASDVLRFHILKEYGGIYVDIDVEFLKPINELLENRAFSGFESSGLVNPGVIVGAVPNHEIICDIVNEYQKRVFEFTPKKQVTVCNIFTDKLLEYGLVCDGTTQTLENIKIYSSEYFSPKSLSDGKIRKTKNTMTIHHFEGTWISAGKKCSAKIKMFIKRLMGQKMVSRLKAKKQAKKALGTRDEQKILHVLSTNTYSGAENVACQIIQAFNGSVKSVYCSPDGTIRNTLNEKQIEFAPIKKLCKKEIKRVLKEFKPTVIHAHDMKAIAISALASKNIPIVGHIHCNHIKFRKTSLKSILFKYLVKKGKVKHAIFVSKESYEDYKYKACLEGKYSILPNVINKDQFLQKVNESQYTDKSDIVYLGRLSYIKNPKRIVEITKLVSEKLPDVKVAIIGNGEEENNCKNLAKELGVQNNITFYGFLDNGYGLLKNSKVQILTSISEGTPMCALEGQVCGLPIVSTKTGGMMELLKDGETGFLFDSNEEAASLIIRLLTDKTYYSKISNNVKLFSSDYNNIEKYKAKVLAIYESVKFKG